MITINIKGIESTRNKMNKLLVNIPNVVDKSMTTLFEDIISQAMENLRNRLLNTTYSRGDSATHVKLTDNLDLWDYERITFSAGNPNYYQWKLWNKSDHAAPVEFGSRSIIKPHGDYLYLGGGKAVTQVRGQNPKHFFGDALYYQNSTWRRNIRRYFQRNIKLYLR
jgi:hypothetical protein